MRELGVKSKTPDSIFQSGNTRGGRAFRYVAVDGKHILFAVHVDSGGHRDRDIFFSYDVPVKYTTGNADVHVEANPPGCFSDVEIQSLMQITFQ
jgi:hypothetical protein